jgi:hypothetical protein
MSSTLLNDALKYKRLGWFVLPVHRVEKRPLIKWAHRKDKRPTVEEIREWYKRWPSARIGIATGKPSGFDVVDLDGPQARERFDALYGTPETIRADTGRTDGGVHLFFKHNGHGLRSLAGKDENRGIDLKTDGGFVVVAPSPHKSGKHYQWSNINPGEYGLDDLLEMPPEIIEHFKKQNRGSLERNPITFEPVENGARNETLARIVGKWISQGLDRETALLAANGWNSKLDEPLCNKEVLTTVESIFRTHERNHPIRSIKILSSSSEKNKRPLRFPYQVMTGSAGYFANVLSSYMEAPQEFFFMSYLTCLGSVVSPKLTLKSILQTQPRLNVLLLGESASERKSTTLKQVHGHFASVLDGSFNCCWGIGSAEGLQKILNKKQTDREDPVTLLLIFDEFKSFVNKCAIETSVLLPFVNTLFESNVYETHTKKQSISIRNAHISMLAASTKATYERIYTPAFLDIGFPNRVFIVPGTAKRQFSIPPQIPESEKGDMKKHTRLVLEHIGEGLVLDLTKEAVELYDKWYMGLKPSIYTKRLDTYSLRLMQLLAVNELKDNIDTEIVEHAIALCYWQYEVRKLYDPIDAETKSAKMEESIRRALSRCPKKDWELKRSTGANRMGLFIYRMAIKNLESEGEIGIDTKTNRYFLIN